jgi:predicted peptidase
MTQSLTSSAGTRIRSGTRALSGSCLLLLALQGGLLAQEWEMPERSQANLDALARVELRTYEMPQADGAEVEYRVYVPTGYDSDRATPLVIALHGLGSDTMYMMEYNNLVELAEEYGYIVATPMGFNERGWYGSRGAGSEFNRRSQDSGPDNLGELSELDVMNVLALMREEYNVDERRIYLIGQSMGGAGTWHLGMKHPDVWAALAPMAPAIYSSPDALVTARDLPVVVVMGDADTAVDVEVTRQWVAKMEELGMSYEYIEVAGGTHFSAGRQNIDKVFAFLEEHRKEAPRRYRR